MSIADHFGKRGASNGGAPRLEPPTIDGTDAPSRRQTESRLVTQVETEIGAFIRDHRDNLPGLSLGEAIDTIDPEAPPERAVEVANLLTSNFESYIVSLDKVRAAAIQETARLVHEIDVTKGELAGSRDRLAAQHLDFMRRIRNHVVAVADLRRTLAAQRPVQPEATTHGQQAAKTDPS